MTLDLEVGEMDIVSLVCMIGIAIGVAWVIYNVILYVNSITPRTTIKNYKVEKIPRGISAAQMVEEDAAKDRIICYQLATKRGLRGPDVDEAVEHCVQASKACWFEYYTTGNKPPLPRFFLMLDEVERSRRYSPQQQVGRQQQPRHYGQGYPQQQPLTQNPIPMDEIVNNFAEDASLMTIETPYGRITINRDSTNTHNAEPVLYDYDELPDYNPQQFPRQGQQQTLPPINENSRAIVRRQPENTKIQRRQR